MECSCCGRDRDTVALPSRDDVRLCRECVEWLSGKLGVVSTPTLPVRALREAKTLSLGFCHWIQTECPRDEGGTGYPECLLRPDVLGTEDGLSKYPYILRYDVEVSGFGSHQSGHICLLRLKDQIPPGGDTTR